MRKRLLSILSCLVLILLSFIGFKSVYAASSVSLVFTSDQYLEIDANNASQVNFYTNAGKTVLAGSATFSRQGFPIVMFWMATTK